MNYIFYSLNEHIVQCLLPKDKRRKDREKIRKEKWKDNVFLDITNHMLTQLNYIVDTAWGL